MKYSITGEGLTNHDIKRPVIEKDGYEFSKKVMKKLIEKEDSAKS